MAISVPVINWQVPQNNLGDLLQTMLGGYQTTKYDWPAKAIENELSKVQLKYAPMTALADAASKLAYAQLMGPQFISKLMGNTDILANLPEDVKNTLLPSLVQAGTSNPLPLNSNVIRNVFEKNYNENYPVQNQTRLNYESSANMPSINSYEQRNVIPNQFNYSPGQPQTWAERTGQYEGIVNEGKEAGTIRAKDIGDFGKQIESGMLVGDKFNALGNILNDPTFKTMRERIPFFQKEQLFALSKVGTKEEQRLIGNFINTTQEVVKDTINAFSGQRLASEAQISRDMKVNENDTVEVALGKVEAAMIYKQMAMDRARIAADIMENEHVSKNKALQKADKLINGDEIRKKIDDKLQLSFTPFNQNKKSTMKGLGALSTEELIARRDKLKSEL